jgi:hypothetical protein
VRYTVGHVAPRRETRWLAAVLACGPGAVLSHRSAATLWLFRKGEGWRPDVTIAPGERRKHPGITIHRSRLAPQDVTVHAGIAVTTPTRTVFDLERELDDDQVLARAVREARYLGHFDTPAARELLTRRPSKAIRALIRERTLTRTELEDRMRKLCHRYELPRPLTQHAVLARTIDFVRSACIERQLRAALGRAG